MSKRHVNRFAAGTPEQIFSGIWHLVVLKNEIYLGPSGRSMESVKLSLHSSGVWAFAMTTQSTSRLPNGNRRVRQWRQPPESAAGVTRGPSVIVPNTSVGSRFVFPSELEREIQWFPAPGHGEHVEFGLYLLRPHSRLRLSPGEELVARAALRDGRWVEVVAGLRTSSPEFLAEVERKVLEASMVGAADTSPFRSGALLWLTESPDARRVPLIVDVPLLATRNPQQAPQ